MTSETEFASVEGPLNMHKTASNETILVSKILVYYYHYYHYYYHYYYYY